MENGISFPGMGDQHDIAPLLPPRDCLIAVNHLPAFPHPLADTIFNLN